MPDVPPRRERARLATLLGRYLVPQRGRAAGLAALLLVGTGLELLAPVLLGRFIDAAVAGEALRALLGLAGLYLAVALGVQGLGAAERGLAADVGLRATNALRADLTAHLLRLDLAAHRRRPAGELIERVDGDVGRLASFFSRFVADLLGNALLLLGALGALFVVDARVGLALGLFALLTLAALAGLRDVAVPRFRAAREAAATLFGTLEEGLAAREELRANGAAPHLLRRVLERSRTLLRREVGAGVVGNATYGVSVLLFAVGGAVALGLGGWLFLQGAATLGTVYLIYRYTELLARPLQLLGRQVQELQQAGAAALRVQELLALRSVLPDAGRRPLPAGPLAVRFEGVRFRYADDAEADGGGRAALDGVAFALPAGATLGLLGRSGSGKSTLARLLFRFFDPQEGAVRLGGEALPELPLAALRSRVALVPQDVRLFRTSLRANLTLFREDVPDARLLEALDAVGLTPWAEGLPHGLDTVLAGDGGGLSAGQAQLLAFARAFLADPGLVVLDEASSRLDPATEARLERAVDRLLRGRTAVVIAHRLATVRRADWILLLEDGRVAEFGRREALAADPGSRFHGLLQRGLEEALA